jgi:putative oxidoreductase
MSLTTLDGATIGSGLLVARVALGLAMAAHGSQKLLGWFGGYGLKGTGGFFEGLGFRPGVAFAAAASLSEMLGGLLLALGFLGPVGPAIIIAVMIVAAVTVHLKNGFFAASNGFEVPYLYAAGAAALALTGFGAYSMDSLLGLDSLWAPAAVWAVLAAGVLGGFMYLLLRRPAPAPAPVAAQH